MVDRKASRGIKKFDSKPLLFITTRVFQLTYSPTVCVTCGWAGVDKTPRPRFCSGVGKSPKMPQNPTRQVHALLGALISVTLFDPSQVFLTYR